ncbi:MAG TPA: hypothetical protein DEO93_13750, partial [Stenotrophomonas sp.]|nr:hypothetical protein [Stenotrophomonas sp.]
MQAAGRLATATFAAAGAPDATQHRCVPVQLYNTTSHRATDRCRPDGPLPHTLTRLLRRCPLLPSELALLEARLLALLVDATPDELAAHLAQAVRDTPVAARRSALLQAMAGWQAAPSPAQDAWHRECTQVVAAIVSALGRLQ